MHYPTKPTRLARRAITAARRAERYDCDQLADCARLTARLARRELIDMIGVPATARLLAAVGGAS